MTRRLYKTSYLKDVPHLPEHLNRALDDKAGIDFNTKRRALKRVAELAALIRQKRQEYIDAGGYFLAD